MKVSHFPIPEINKWNLKLRHITIYISIPQNEILKYKSKYVQDLNEENYKTLMNYIKELSICHCSWIRKLNIVIDISTSQPDLWIQYNLSQNASKLFCR